MFSLSPSLGRKRVAFILVAISACLLADNFQPSDVKVLGALKYGQTSQPITYSGEPQYAAFVFNGHGDDQIEVTVKSPDRKALVAIADGSLNQLASDTTHLVFSLPNHGPDPEAFYIVFRDSENKQARFTVELKKVAGAPSQ
jgi:hypothetical protein